MSRYITALKHADVRIGVITNHNKFDRDEFRRALAVVPVLELESDHDRNLFTARILRKGAIGTKAKKDHRVKA